MELSAATNLMRRKGREHWHQEITRVPFFVLIWAMEGRECGLLWWSGVTTNGNGGHWSFNSQHYGSSRRERTNGGGSWESIVVMGGNDFRMTEESVGIS
jgi:hypothetical protein